MHLFTTVSEVHKHIIYQLLGLIIFKKIHDVTYLYYIFTTCQRHVFITMDFKHNKKVTFTLQTVYSGPAAFSQWCHSNKYILMMMVVVVLMTIMTMMMMMTLTY